MIVVDANVLAFHCLPGPRRDAARAVFRRDPDWAAPRLCRSEFTNVLALCVRRGERGLADAVLVLEAALEALAGRELPVDPGEVLRTAVSSGCTAYDCEYVVLARTLGVPLVTDDRQVLRAFPGLAVSMEAFAHYGG